MSFDIYDVTAYSRESAANEAVEADIVESGLSPGELRQSLLDRFREEVRSESVYFINMNLELAGFDPFEDDILEDENNAKCVLNEIESFLYEAVDSVMDGTIWEFSDEMVLVKGQVE